MDRFFTLPTFKHFSRDFPAGIVVFLVALPLCLGIALASGAPLMSGLIAGIIGGIVISFFSGSEMSVSGPAAGLAVIVLTAIENLGQFEIFLAAVVLAGVIQFGFGIAKGGIFGEYVPNSVIKGMLAGIGVVIIKKQIGHLVGWDVDVEAVEEAVQLPHLVESTPWDPIVAAFTHIELGPMVIGLSCLAFLIFWETPFRKNLSWTKLAPGPLLAVVLGMVINQILLVIAPEMALTQSVGDHHLVSIPEDVTVESMFTFPDFSAIGSSEVIIAAVTIAVIASIETLLSVEAVDKLDPEKRISDTNRELRAQGIGNTLSGLIGGLPITAVIVRSSTNVYAGGRTRLSSIIHGVLLLVCVLFVEDLLRMIPLAALAAVLVSVGYKLTSVEVIKGMWKQGLQQFLPFIITIVAIERTDLLTGIGIGLLTSIFFVMRANHHASITLVHDDDSWMIRFNKDVTFVNKAELKKQLRKIPDDTKVVINGRKAQLIDHDIYETLGEFAEGATYRNIHVEYHNVFGKQKF